MLDDISKYIQRPAPDIAIEAQEEINNTEFIPSRYGFLNSHKGIRPHTLHGLMSNTGAGKSTLFKCIIAETAAACKVLIWISEETKVEYQVLLNKIDKSILDNVVFIEERNLPKEILNNQNKLFEFIIQVAKQSQCGVFFIDNVTTSALYNSTFGLSGQRNTALFMVQFVKNICSMFYVAHTGPQVTDNYRKVIVSEDIRGCKDLPNLTEYFYTIQKFTNNGAIFNILKRTKNRHHTTTGTGTYTLVFAQGYYIADDEISFELVNYIFKGRDYLGRKSPPKPKDKPKVEEPVEKQERFL